MENNKEKKDRKRIVDLLIKIILIVIIILLLIHNCVLNKLNDDLENNPIPSGNVDIIEIKCDKEDICHVDDNATSVNGEGNDEASPLDIGGKVIVYDNEITWNGETEAKIFSNSMYEIQDVIAPESSNTYQFVVKNGTIYNIKYNINFIENNPYEINMKYRLKKNDTYITNDYVSANELEILEMNLESGKNDTYYLEWKWFSSENDTKVGKALNADYGLKIEIKAESTNG